MFTFIIILILCWLFDILTQHTAPPPSRKRKAKKSFKTNGSKVILKSDNLDKFTETIEKKTDPEYIKIIGRAPKDCSQKEQSKAVVCDTKERALSPSEAEFKYQNKSGELERARKTIDQAVLTTLQSNTSKEYETNKSSVRDVNRHKFTATMEKKTDLEHIGTLTKVPKDCCEKEQHQASVCDLEKKVRFTSNAELKYLNDHKEKLVRKLEQVELSIHQSIKRKEWKTNKTLVREALVADHRQVHCIYCRENERITKRGVTKNGITRYHCKSCSKNFQSEYKSDKKKLSALFDKQQSDIRTRIQSKVKSKLEAKSKLLIAEQFLQKHDYSDIDLQEQVCIEPVEPVNFLSTTAYAKAYNLKAYPNLFNYLCQHQLVQKVDKKYELTNIGKSLGGQYQTGKDGNKWIAWPERSLDSYVTQLQRQLISEMPFDHLYHMTHIDNVAGIIQHGLQSHINTYKIKDISNLDVNIRRQKKETVNSKPIHSYVPFYFNARNAMLYQVQKQYGDQVVILGYDKSLVCHKRSVYSDGNAAANLTKFYGDLTTLLDHDWGEVFSINWASNGNVDSNLKRKMMSEVLIDETVPVSELRVIYCASPSVESIINRICTLKHVKVKVEPSLFF